MNPWWKELAAVPPLDTNRSPLAAVSIRISAAPPLRPAVVAPRREEAGRSDCDPFAPAICRLHDGTTVCIRPLEFGDAPLVRHFLRSLPVDESMTSDALRCSVTLIAIRHGARSGDGQVLGVGTLERRDPRDMSVLRLTLRVAVGYRGIGLGSLIGARLSAMARRLSASRVLVDVAAGDGAMQAVCRRLGFVFSTPGRSERVTGWLTLQDEAFAT